jgi:hypothetical protein
MFVQSMNRIKLANLDLFTVFIGGIMKTVFFVISVLCFVRGQLPDSPCPSVFSYQYDYDAMRWSGQIRVQNPPSGSIKVDGNFTLAAALENVSFVS